MSDHAKPYLSPREVARRTGVSTDTLRHYETRGVLPAPSRSAAGYRRYPPETVTRVQLIQRALRIGFSIDELTTAYRQRDRGGVPCQRVYRLVESGLVRKLDMPDPHLYFQAPGGQCLRLVGVDEDMSFYEGSGEGPDVAKVKEAIKKEATRKRPTE